MEVDILGTGEVAGGKFFRRADVEHGERRLGWIGLRFCRLLADQFDGLRRLDIDNGGGGISGVSGSDEQEEASQSEWFCEQVHGQRSSEI
jgi:hypothetical protein